MSLRFYNTLTNRLESFAPIEPNHVGLYTCGPTVYNHAHIGNFRSYVFEDLVKRFLIYSGYRVKQVMNITDVDDKIMKKATESGQSLTAVTAPFVESFFRDIDRLNIQRADIYPRATEHIEPMLKIVESLVEKGFAYEKAGSVYFSIAKFPDYGRLANISPDSLKSGVRVDSDEYEKDDVQDFVLWKGKKPGEHAWPSPFGDGRPGWHIECSAMSSAYLGNHFDIHMGGVDNIFPHHENEIAQSHCATGEPFVNYWIHCQHLIVDGEKMSKSLGNQYTLQDVLDRGYDALEIRFLLLATHYRKLLNFTFQGLDQARQTLKRIHDFVFTLEGLQPADGVNPRLRDRVAAAESAFREQMNDDFNISGALGVIFELIHDINRSLAELKSGDIQHILTFMDDMNAVLGIRRAPADADLDEEIQQQIEARRLAREQKDFARADAIRDELKKRGIILIDTPEGTRWKKES